MYQVFASEQPFGQEMEGTDPSHLTPLKRSDGSLLPGPSSLKNGKGLHSS